ncbi:U-box domain-containing protein 19-like [Durio zibethinus]|uniref:U-box domain-containing protein 19-like n=1 Tax=Durio zibethinus TaxID=66656 RepID=A0A6P5XBL3_DURZI|nr:U-box domain-containing protein 19-like [Durio zibethinus]
MAKQIFHVFMWVDFEMHGTARGTAAKFGSLDFDVTKSFNVLFITPTIVTDSLAVLATLAEKVDGTVAILRRGALQLLVRNLNTFTSRTAKEYCVSLLLALCVNGGLDVVVRLVKNPCLMGSLYSQLSEGTTRASKKASAIIRILHEFYEKRSSASATPVVPRERFVHAW